MLNEISILDENFLNKILKMKDVKEIYNFIFDGNSESIQKRTTDLNMFNNCLSRAILPFISQQITHFYDPLSSQSTKNLSENLKSLYFLPIFRSKSQLNLNFYQKLLEKFQNSISNDLFIPNNGQIITNNKDFFQRQIWKNVKMIDNFLRFTGFFSEKIVQKILIGSVLSKNLSIGLSLNQDGRLQKMVVIKLRTLFKQRKVESDFYNFVGKEWNDFGPVSMFFRKFE